MASDVEVRPALPKSSPPALERFDVDDVIERVGVGASNLFTAAFALCSYSVAVMSVLTPNFAAYIPADYLGDFCSNQSGVSYKLPPKYPRQESLMLEFELICSWPTLPNVMTMVFFLAGIGSLIANYLADKFGRRRLIRFSLALDGVGFALVYFAPTAEIYLAFQAFAGFLCVLISNSSAIILVEAFSNRFRAFVFCVLYLCFPLGFCAISLGAYLVVEWRRLHLLVASSFGVALTLSFLAPESLRWLATRRDEPGRLAFREACSKMLSKSGKTLEKVKTRDPGIPDGKELNVSTDSKSPWRSKEIWKRLIATCYLTMVSEATFWAASIAASEMLPGNRFVNLACLGLLHLPSIALSAAAVKLFPYRKSIAAFAVVSAASNFVNFALQILGWTMADAPVVFATAFGRLFGGAYVVLVHFVCIEVFPTSCRSSCFGVVIVAGRATLVLVSFTSVLVRTAPAALPAALGVSIVVAAAVVMTTEETKGQRMAQTVEELEEVGRGKRRRKEEKMGKKNVAEENKIEEAVLVENDPKNVSGFDKGKQDKSGEKIKTEETIEGQGGAKLNKI